MGIYLLITFTLYSVFTIEGTPCIRLEKGFNIGLAEALNLPGHEYKKHHAADKIEEGLSGSHL